MALKENKIPSQEDLKYQPTKFTDEELNKLKNKKIDIPEVDLSGIDDCKDKLDDLAAKLDKFEKRLTKVEKSSKGRF